MFTGISGFFWFLAVAIVVLVAGFGIRIYRGKDVSESVLSSVVDVAIVFVVAVALFVLASKIARADEGFGLHSAELRLGLFHELGHEAHYCERQHGVEALYGEPEFAVEVYRNNQFSAETAYRHNSCAVGGDSGRSSDRVGIVLRYRVW